MTTVTIYYSLRSYADIILLYFTHIYIYTTSYAHRYFYLIIFEYAIFIGLATYIILCELKLLKTCFFVAYVMVVLTVIQIFKMKKKIIRMQCRYCSVKQCNVIYHAVLPTIYSPNSIFHFCRFRSFYIHLYARVLHNLETVQFGVTQIINSTEHV